MTLIAAWRCDAGIVIQADSQETVTMEDGTEYRKTVQKLEPIEFGNYQVTIAGEGQPASLIISFIEKLKRRLQVNTSETIQAFAALVEDELSQFHAKDVATCPDKDKDVKFLVAASCRVTKEYNAWISQNTMLVPISDSSVELMGWREVLYQEIADTFFSRGMNIGRAVLAGLYVMNLAEATSNYVRNPYKIAVVRENGIWTEEDEYVREMLGRLADYELPVFRLFLACADTSISVADFDKYLQTEFLPAVLDLHKRHIDRVVDGLTFESMSQTNDSYPRLPVGGYVMSMLANGKFKMQHDPMVVQQFKEVLNRFRNYPLYFQCAECEAEYEYRVSSVQGDDWKCPSCNSVVKTPAKVVRFRKLGDVAWTEA